MLMPCAFSWAACPVWEGKVKSALAHICSAMESLLRWLLQLPAPAFAFSFLNLHPEILRPLYDALPPNLLYGSARLLLLGQCTHPRDLVQKGELWFSFVSRICRFMTGFLMVRPWKDWGKKKTTNKQWRGHRKRIFKILNIDLCFFPDISAESQRAVQRGLRWYITFTVLHWWWIESEWCFVTVFHKCKWLCIEGYEK